MSLVELIGCLLLAFSPPLIMFLLTVAKDPIRVIVLITRYGFSIKYEIKILNIF